MKSGLLTVENLSVCFDVKKVVDAVSFCVEPGQLVSIIGDSGCGKSQTLLAITRLNNKASVSGSVRLSTHHASGELNLISADEKTLSQVRGRQIAYIFQDPSTALNPLMKVGDQLIYFMKQRLKVNSNEALGEIYQIFEKLNLGDVKRLLLSYPHELSGGMKQRVLIALAVLFKARLILADEPTTALDERSSDLVMDTLSLTRKQFSTAVILVTHDLELARQSSDKIYTMHQGRIIDCLQRDENFKAHHKESQRLMDMFLLDTPHQQPLEIL